MSANANLDYSPRNLFYSVHHCFPSAALIAVFGSVSDAVMIFGSPKIEKEEEKKAEQALCDVADARK